MKFIVHKQHSGGERCLLCKIVLLPENLTKSRSPLISRASGLNFPMDLRTDRRFPISTLDLGWKVTRWNGFQMNRTAARR